MNDNEPLFLYDDGLQSGPMPFHEAKALWKDRRLGLNAFYWAQGMPEWLPVQHLFKKHDEHRHPGTGDSIHSVQNSALEKTTSRRHRILVVDDDPILCEILLDMLSNAGFEVDTTEDYRPAVQILQKNGLNHYDGVVTDYNMPGGSGVELVRWIKARENALQVILLTAQDNKEVVKLGLRAGVFDFLEKPLHRKGLLTALNLAVQETLRNREERAAYLELIRLKLAGRGRVAEQMIASLVQRESSLGGLLSKLETILAYSEQLETRNNGTLPGSAAHLTDTPFQGKIGDLSLLELAQLLVQSGKTGELHLTDDTLKNLGCISFLDGKIVHASDATHTALPALTRLMTVDAGYFTFYHEREASRQTIHGNTMSILLEISSRMDERSRKIAA